MDEKYLNQRRQASNRELLIMLEEKIEMWPSQRFSQILRNAGFVNQEDTEDGVVWTDEFNLEPWVLQKRVTKMTERYERERW